MCHTVDNTLLSNENELKEMFLMGKLTKSEFIGRIAAAENAERMHRILMEQTGWTPEQLFVITSYRILPLKTN